MPNKGRQTLADHDVTFPAKGSQTAALPDIAVCILAGGASRRFGSEKAFAELCGKPLLAHVIDNILPQTSGPVLVNGNDTGAYAGFGLPVIPDGEWSGAGPLSGIHAALKWALHAARARVVTVAVDQPFLPKSYIATLVQDRVPTIAKCGGRLHPINAVWSVSDLPALRKYLETGKRDVHGWAEISLAEIIEFPAGHGVIDPFLNVNTKADLAVAAQFLGQP